MSVPLGTKNTMAVGSAVESAVAVSIKTEDTVNALKTGKVISMHLLSAPSHN